MRRREEEPKMATTETQTVEFSLTEDDYVAYSQLVATRSWHKWLMYGVGGFLLLSAGLNVMNDLYVPGALWGDVWIVALGVAMFFFPAILAWIARWRFRSAAFARVRAPIRIEISPAGLRSIGGIADSMTPWPSIIDIRVTPAGAYLFIFKNSAHIVPRRAFADGVAFKDFVAAASHYWRPGA